VALERAIEPLPSEKRRRPSPLALGFPEREASLGANLAGRRWPRARPTLGKPTRHSHDPGGPMILASPKPSARCRF